MPQNSDARYLVVVVVAEVVVLWLHQNRNARHFMMVVVVVAVAWLHLNSDARAR